MENIAWNLLMRIRVHFGWNRTIKKYVGWYKKTIDSYHRLNDFNVNLVKSLELISWKPAKDMNSQIHHYLLVLVLMNCLYLGYSQETLLITSAPPSEVETKPLSFEQF